MKKTKAILSFIILSSLIFLSGCGKTSSSYKVNLEIWGVFDNSDAYTEIISRYRDLNNYVGNVKYRKFDVNTYKTDLLDALASGQGPDIFMVQNNWLPSFKDKIEPAPDYLLKEQDFRSNFLDIAADDFVAEGKIYAVPMSIDSLALYYNKDLFNAEGITRPPATWKEFSEAVKKLTKIDRNGNITQSGAAIGTAYNINRSTDILNLMMMQTGVQIADEEGKALFDKNVVAGGKAAKTGESAWTYYTDFSRIGSPLYSWNGKMHYSIDAFYEGTAAMMINYSWQYSAVKSKNAKLNFAVAPIPQSDPEKPVDYPNYWALAVAKNKLAPVANPNLPKPKTAPVSNEVRVREAWQFLRNIAMKNDKKITLYNSLNLNSKEFAFDFDPAKHYVEKTGRPAARRDIIEEQKSDVLLGPFAYGNLIAKSWYETNPEAIETILAESIDKINKGEMTIPDSMAVAVNRINQLVAQ
jgi:multiple sugar transport system substrate-binding protein